MGALEDLVRRDLGVDTEPIINPLTDEVGVVPIRIVANNPHRVGLLVINLSANTIFVTPDGAPSSARGIRLGAGGGQMALLAREDFHLTGWELFAVASGAASALFVLEVVAKVPR